MKFHCFRNIYIYKDCYFEDLYEVFMDNCEMPEMILSC